MMSKYWPPAPLPARKVYRPEGRTYGSERNNKLQAPNYNIQISNKIKSQLFGILNIGHCYLPFDLALGGELVEPFVI